jgi:hypothetical protein
MTVRAEVGLVPRSSPKTLGPRCLVSNPMETGNSQPLKTLLSPASLPPPPMPPPSEAQGSLTDGEKPPWSAPLLCGFPPHLLSLSFFCFPSAQTPPPVW